MKVKELIEKLNAYNPDLEVCVFDWRKNLHHQDDFGSSMGIENKFEIQLMGASEEESIEREKAGMKRRIPWLGIAFKNNDYDDGRKAIAWELGANVEVMLCGRPVLLKIHEGVHLNQDNAIKKVKDAGGRPITKEEAEYMRKIPYRWDNERPGGIFTFETTKGGKVDVFLPACGIGYSGHRVICVDSVACYWLSPCDGSDGYSLFFSGHRGASIKRESNREFEFSVLLVKDI